MMKKNGFTLAEVLITLAIIGVVATMTLPALMTNTGEQQAKTGLKKMVNTLTEAAQMHKTVSGFDFGEFGESADIDNEATDDTQTMEALLRARVAIDYAKTGDGSNTYDSGESLTGAHTSYDGMVVYLRDNTVIWYNPEDTIAEEAHNTLDDHLPQGFIIAVDTNGVKGPNIMSNCSGTQSGDIATEAGYDALADFTGINDICTRENRVIKDQFLLRLRGTAVQPQGAAAYWAYNN